MKLTKTVIDHKKLKDCLLLKRKRNDKSKWLNKAGYTLNNWKILEKDLRSQILSLEPLFLEKTEYGNIYEIKGKLKGPNGKELNVNTIWMTEFESELTKFITMFPNKRMR